MDTEVLSGKRNIIISLLTINEHFSAKYYTVLKNWYNGTKLLVHRITCNTYLLRLEDFLEVVVAALLKNTLEIINQAISFVSSDIISNISSTVFTSLSMPSYMSYARASAKKYKTKNGQDVVNDIAAELLSAGHSGC